MGIQWSQYTQNTVEPSLPYVFSERGEPSSHQDSVLDSNLVCMLVPSTCVSFPVDCASSVKGAVCVSGVS